MLDFPQYDNNELDKMITVFEYVEDYCNKESIALTNLEEFTALVTNVTAQITGYNHNFSQYCKSFFSMNFLNICIKKIVFVFIVKNPEHLFESLEPLHLLETNLVELTHDIVVESKDIQSREFQGTLKSMKDLRYKYEYTFFVEYLRCHIFSSFQV